MPIKHVAAAPIHYQSPKTGENTYFEAGDTIPDEIIEEWPNNSLIANISMGYITTQATSGGRKPKPAPAEASSPTEASIADVKKGIEQGVWTLDEVLDAERALPESEQRKGILDLAPEDDAPEGDDEQE